MDSKYVVVLIKPKINITNTLVKMLVGIFVTCITDVCMKIANENENRQRDHGKINRENK